MPFYDVPTRQESLVWVSVNDGESQPAMKKKISTGLIKAIKLKGQKIVTANWYTTKCLPEILQEGNFRGLRLHHNNASFHTAGLTADDRASNLFSVSNYNLRGRRFHSEEKIDVFFSRILRNEWFQVFNMRKIRLQKCIDAAGDYFEQC
ncbi:UNVERIFIED_CONTAM: hypothetical protein NCL1_29592 [Trichonephila clavipes]